MSGSGGDTGYDYQANATAYVAAHGLAGQSLPWFEGHNAVPATWRSETGGPGEDIGIVTVASFAIEIEAKHALKRGPEYIATFQRLIAGLRGSVDLRCVLLVDRHTSAVIRDDLKHDIARLGEGRSDGLKQVTLDLLTKLGESTQSVGELFSRLRIIVVDLDEGSDGVSLVQTLLSRVVPPEKAILAYELLGKRYHRTIKRRGQDTVHSCARFLAENVGLSLTTNSPAAITTRFADFIRKTTEAFYSPALQVRFPIEEAWDQVAPLQPNTSTLQAQIERYQEWTRLTRSGLPDDSMTAEIFAGANPHSVIIAGPGAGKTTLGEKMAHSLSENMLVVRVRLPMVKGMVADGTTFDAAFARAAVDTSGFGEREGHQILASAEMLIADGLDECDPDRATVAEAISRWATSHPNARVCVLTRPVGHSPDLLTGFMHAELTPLDAHSVRRLAGQMLAQKAAAADQTRLAAEFRVAIENSETVAGIAARNPLLLSFLVALFLDRQPIEGNRAELFHRMIEQIRKIPSRRQAARTAQVDYASSMTAAEALGWSCLERPDRSVTELYHIVAKKLGDGDSAVRTAEAAIHDWIERGLLERLTAGSLDAVVFVHLAFAEYLAGRYLADLGASEFALAIANLRRKAKWREPILLSAGAGAADQLVATLLDLDQPGHSESTEAMLAAAAIQEAAPAPVSPALVEQVIARLKDRLPSPIPLVSIDAGVALLAIASGNADAVAAAALEFWSHPQEWTRLAAQCTVVGSRSRLISIADVSIWLEQFKFRRPYVSLGDMPPSAWTTGIRELQNAALASAAKRVATELPPEEAKHRITTLLKNDRLSLAMVHAIEAELSVEPYRTWVLEANWLDRESIVKAALLFRDIAVSSKRAAHAVMECVIAGCGATRDESVHGHSGYKLLSALFGSMGLGEATLSDFTAAALSKQQFSEVLRGWIAGLGIDPVSLAAESNCFLNCDEDLMQVPRLTGELNQERVRSAELNPSVLLDAMQQSSLFLAKSSARLFAYNDSPERGRLLDKVLENGQGTVLWFVGLFASSVWGTDAFPRLLKKLSSQSGDKSGLLYPGLIRSAGNAAELESAIESCLDGVGSVDPTVAVRAADALRECSGDALARHAVRLRELFEHWESRGSWCRRCDKPVHDSSCQECHVVPPEPHKHLVALLDKSRAIGFEELAKLSNRERFGVSEEARKALIALGRRNAQEMDKLLSSVGTGSVNDSIVNDVLRLPTDELKKMAEPLRRLLGGGSIAARARVVRSLAAGWLPGAEATELAQKALLDDAPEVRTAAATVLRELAQR
jgi:hypothetical protein